MKSYFHHFDEVTRRILSLLVTYGSPFKSSRFCIYVFHQNSKPTQSFMLSSTQQKYKIEKMFFLLHIKINKNQNFTIIHCRNQPYISQHFIVEDFGNANNKWHVKLEILQPYVTNMLTWLQIKRLTLFIKQFSAACISSCWKYTCIALIYDWEFRSLFTT